MLCWHFHMFRKGTITKVVSAGTSSGRLWVCLLTKKVRLKYWLSQRANFKVKLNAEFVVHRNSSMAFLLCEVLKIKNAKISVRPHDSMTLRRHWSAHVRFATNQRKVGALHGVLPLFYRLVSQHPVDVWFRGAGGHAGQQHSAT